MFNLTIGVGPLRPLAAQLEACGIDAAAFFTGRGLDPSVLGQRDARVPIPRLIGIWERAAEAAGDEHFGLHAGSRLAPGELGLVGDLCEASATLGDALGQLSRYLRLVTETVTLRVRVEGAVAAVSAAFRMPPFAQGRHAVEFTVASLLHFMRQAARARVVPTRVLFRHRRAAKLDGYRRVLEAPAEFAAGQNAIELDAALLRSELVGRDSERARAFNAVAHQVLIGQVRPPLTEQVARAVMGELRLGVEPTVEAVAQGLAVSVRSLQRALRSEGETFGVTVDRLRRELALHHLADATLSVSEVAFVLGFSEPAAFHRAFRRWTGKTPLAHRAQLAAASSSPS
jgi:AraC-like DNA-binding protein